MRQSFKHAALFSALTLPTMATALTVQETSDANILANALLGSNIKISNISYSGAVNSAGLFSDAADVIGFDAGIVLSSGRAGFVAGPNLSDAKTQANYLLGDTELNALIPGYTTHDSTVLEFDFIPNSNVFSFQYVFSSEEYNEWVNTSFNDVFGFFLDGKNIATLPGSDVTVSINSINGGNPFGFNVSNPQYFINNDLTDGGGHLATEMDGMTVVLSVQAEVTAGQTHHIKLAIADAGDSILDSNVFIKAGSFIDAVSDIDQDGIADNEDNCLHTPNPMQEDYDGDGVGVACDETPAPMPLAFVKMTGGGTVNDGTANFGFNLKSTANGIAAHLQYNHKDSGKKKDGDSTLQIKVNGNVDMVFPIANDKGVEFIAPCTVRTKAEGSERVPNLCEIHVIDSGKGKKAGPDQFWLSIIDGPSAGYESGSSDLSSGNITAHK